MSVIENDLNNLQHQFISVDELLTLLMEIEKCSQVEIAKWLLASNILNKTKPIVFYDNYLILEYEYHKKNSYPLPFDALKLIAEGNIAFHTDIVGFARLRLLNDLKNKGISIPEPIIKACKPYIPHNSIENDDNFYKNQCIDIVRIFNEEIQNANLKNNYSTSENVYLKLIDKKSHMFFSKLEAIARIHYDLNYMDKYSGRSNKDQRIKDCLEEYGQEYGLNHQTPNHIKALATLISTRKDQKTTTNILKSLEIQK